LPAADAPIEFRRTTPDHVPAVSANFRPPKPSVELLPEDWDLDLPAPAPAAPVAPSVSAEELAPPAAQPTPAPPTPTPPPPPPAMAPVPERAGEGERAFAAFAAGAGIEAPAPADPFAVLTGLGAAFRAFVGGLRRVMMARAAIKGEFRIDQTMIQAIGNNPLKFSADDQDAMAALLGIGRRTGMSAERAVSDAMRDIRLHELAMASAMQQAVRELVASLDPDAVAKRGTGGAFLPWRRAARQWDEYRALHRATSRALDDDFDSVFGSAFMRAYERAMAEIGADEQR
jgi:type VI secretion system protein ImpI/type VI secretion system protein